MSVASYFCNSFLNVHTETDIFLKQRILQSIFLLFKDIPVKKLFNLLSVPKMPLRWSFVQMSVGQMSINIMSKHDVIYVSLHDVTYTPNQSNKGLIAPKIIFYPYQVWYLLMWMKSGTFSNGHLRLVMIIFIKDILF